MLAVFLLATGFAALRHGPELLGVGETLASASGFVALWFAYPLVKLCHELAHAYAVKRWGGEVHEVGVLFLVFFPLPYVDAADASMFAERGRRMTVGAAGILCEN